ncbi:MAG: class I tRNA ligase family protein, partial [Gemmatimonadales bacterium]
VGPGRFGEWLANNVDWALSRDRYWGTPLPIWNCDQDPDHVTVIGSYAELAERWGRELPEDFDPHKPFIDEYEWPCGCGGTMRRTPEVIDAWFDSGSMPYAQWHYPFENADAFAEHFPADYICEGVDQTRGWFYSLLAISTCAFDAAAYRHVIVNEQVLDAAGRKMSKSRGNVVDPWESICQYGADAVRLYFLASSQVWLPKRFSTSAIPEVVGGFLNRLRNTYEFFARYATAPGKPDDTATRNLSDRWILSRLDATTALVRASWAGYDVTTGVRAIMDFVDQDLSNWYVRINRARFWAPDREADPAAVETLREVLVTVAKLLAPAAPFLTDWMHRALTDKSVHLAPFPQAGSRRDENLDIAMDAARRLSSLARAGRETVNLRVRQPVARLQVAVPEKVRGPDFDALLELVRLEVNVKVVEVVHSDTDLVRLRARPNFRSLGRRFGKRTPVVAQAASGLAPAQLRALEQGGLATLEVDGEIVEFHPEDVAVERDVTTDWTVQSDGPYVTALDPHLTDDLRREGTARELVHHIQRLRKDAGLAYTTRIALVLDGPDAILDAARAHERFIQEETLARRIEFGGNGIRDAEQDVVVDGTTVKVGFQRLDDGRP